MVVEYLAALGVDVEEVEGSGAAGVLGFDAAKEMLEDWGFEGVVEEGEGGSVGEIEGQRVLLMEKDGGDCWSGVVRGVVSLPDLQIVLRDVGHIRIEFDAEDLTEGEFAGDEHGAAFAGTDVEEGVAVDGVGRDGLAPMVDEGSEDAGCDAVVGGDEGVVGMTSDEVAGGDEAAGVDVVGLIERMNGFGGEFEKVLRALVFGGLGHCQRIWMRLGLPSRPRVLRPEGVMLSGDHAGSWRRTTSVRLTASRPARRLAICAVSWASDASLVCVGVISILTVCF
jgi:hypothetical protein